MSMDFYRVCFAADSASAHGPVPPIRAEVLRGWLSEALLRQLYREDKSNRCFRLKVESSRGIEIVGATMVVTTADQVIPLFSHTDRAIFPVRVPVPADSADSWNDLHQAIIRGLTA